MLGELSIMSEFILDNKEKIVKSGTASFLKSKINVKQRTVFFTTDRFVITRFQLDQWFLFGPIVSFFYFFMEGKQIDVSIKLNDIKEIYLEKHGLGQKITIVSSSGTVSFMPSGVKDWFNLIVKAVSDIYPNSKIEKINQEKILIKGLGEEKNTELDYLNGDSKDNVKSSLSNLSIAENKAKYGIGAFVGIFIIWLLFGSGSSVPSCSDSDTKDLVVQISNDELTKQVGSKVANQVRMSVGAIRTTYTDEKTGAYECSAELDISGPNGKNSIPITYTVEMTDNGEEFYVQVLGL